MPPPRASLFTAFRRSSPLCASHRSKACPNTSSPLPQQLTNAMSSLQISQSHSTRIPILPQIRHFSTSRSSASWLVPKRQLKFKDPKGRPRIYTGGSTRGTTVVWGDYGLRLRDHDRRISAAQLRNGEDVIRRRLRGTNFRIFTRWSASTAVYTKGNESRMGTGKGSFDYWAVRMPVKRVLFEISGDAHEQVIRDALRLAGNKLPGNWEFIRKGDPPVMGITTIQGDVTRESLLKPRRKLAGEITAERLPGSKSESSATL